MDTRQTGPRASPAIRGGDAIASGYL